MIAYGSKVLYPMVVVYLKASGLAPSVREPLRAWGAFTRYLEIGQDKYATRHVDVFANGYAVRYDRSHWIDGLGMLADARYRPRTWDRWWGAGRPMTSDEFEQVWAAAELSPARPLQLSTAEMARLGGDPPWLRR